jgi:23S rRNA (pseudouridine1915-N3)-methyltransferase
MLHLTVWQAGATPRGPWKELQGEYGRFLLPYCQLAERVYRDEASLLARWPGEVGPVVVLEAAGKNPTSEVFAGQVGRWVDAGAKVQVILGGPDGLSANIKEKAEVQLSLSAMTFPHDAALTLFYEQLFRAMTILQGRAYHR